jgi:hypothetical protein
MERCPQHIAIPEKLKLVLNDLGGPKTEAIFEKRKSVRPKDSPKTESTLKKPI